MSPNHLNPDAQTYEMLCEQEIQRAKEGLGLLEKHHGPKTVASVLEPLNELWMVVDQSLNRAGLYRNVHPNKEVRDVADRCEQEISKIVTEIGLSRALYDSVAAMDVQNENTITQRYVQHLLRDFRRAGVDRSESDRAKIRALKDELVQIGQAFNKNVREDVRTMAISANELAGLPDDYVATHKPANDGTITITTDYTDYVPYMTYAQSDSRRFELYRTFRQRGYPKNVQVLTDLLQKRHQLAQLLGYRNWAHYITEDKMIKTPEAAQSFISKINSLADKRTKSDYNDLLAQLKKEQPKAQTVGDWQKSYIEEKLKKTHYRFDSQELRHYFPYENVKKGVLDITSRIFGVHYKRIPTEAWHPSVETYEMWSGDELLGRFYLDMHPRADKYKHAAAFPIRTGVVGKQVPEAALVCNFPGGEDPQALMEHDQVETFFHEFGHLIHHLFGGKQRWVGVSGFNTEWDFVEAPSQMLEEWAWDPRSLKLFAQNDKGQTIPDTLIAAMHKARNFGKGLWVKHQMFYAAVSLAYYNRDPSGLDTTALMKELQAQYSPFSYVDDTYFQYSFGHLDGYSAIYYTYMWSLVIAKDLLSVFEKEGLLNPEPAGRYRKYVLEPGGSKDADVMVSDFLQRPYTFDTFAEWLNRN